jgi:hypothetical protein
MKIDLSFKTLHRNAPLMMKRLKLYKALIAILILSSPLGKAETEAEKHMREMREDMARRRNELAREDQEASAKAAEAATRAAEIAKQQSLPQTYNEAKLWMIEHFEIPRNAKIFAFQVLGAPVRWASISWETTGVIRNNGLGLTVMTVPEQTSSSYHSRSYDFVDQTVTGQSDW